MMTLHKWKQAVVHLECATDSEHYYDRFKNIDRMRAQLDKGEITTEQFMEGLGGKSRDIRYHGTALFIRDATRRYLLTARHVLWDEISAMRELAEEKGRWASWPDHMQGMLMNSARERAQGRIFNIIFRVPRLDEVLAGRGAREFLMNLGAGTSDSVPYTFSAPEIDLACISLDQRNSSFANELEALGFLPIDSGDIADEPISEDKRSSLLAFPVRLRFRGR